MIRWSTTVVVVILAAVAAVVSYRHAYEVISAHGETGWVAYLVPLTIDGLIFASSMVLLDCARRSLDVPWLARLTLALGIAATLAANVMHGWENGLIGSIVAAWPAVALVLSYELLMGLIRRSTVTAVTVEAVPDTTTVVAPQEAERVTEPPATSSTKVEIETSAVADNAGVPDPFSAVPPHVNGHDLATDSDRELLVAEPAFSDQVQPDQPVAATDPLGPVALREFLADVAMGTPPPVRTIKERLSVGTDRARRLQSYLGGLVEVSR